MENKEFLKELQKRVLSVYREEALFPLRGENNSYLFNDRNILMWFGEVTRHSSCHFNGHFNYNKALDDLLFTSDEIVYFTAHLYLYESYISSPIKDAYPAGENIVYPFFENLYGRRFNMYINILYEKLYNFWDRIGDLIASFYPDILDVKKVYFHSILEALERDYSGEANFEWLKSFLNTEYKELNGNRRKIVHYSSLHIEDFWNHLERVTDYESAAEIHDKLLSFPDFFKGMNELTKVGFEKTLNLLSEINSRENYNCNDIYVESK